MKQKVLVFGGAFSPPTLAHEAIIAACLALPGFDEVWLLPSGDRADKQIAISDDDRLRLLELLKAERFGSDPRLLVSDFELRLPRPTQTYRTVQALQHAYQDTSFWFALGADAYLSMPGPNWEHGDALQKQLKMVVFGDSGLSDSPGNVQYLRLGREFGEVSSTKARHALTHGESLDGLVSPPVARYVQKLF